MNKKPMRLQKYIAACGTASRRKAEELIINGKVTVNGHPAQIGMNVIPGNDIVVVNGTRINLPREKVYIALNKPRGYVTTMSDELGRKCITELIKDVGTRVFPIGRLDKDSEGLLLLTDDGDFANALMHPSKHVPKIYHVSVRPAITEDKLIKIETGIELDGVMTAPAKARVLRQYPDKSVVEITLYEGRNREIRRMCEQLGLEVARLSRVGVGNVKLGGLKPGTWRELGEKEVSSLKRAAGLIKRK
jgi:ribosomal large subunit pseudouridine synthase B (EC 5.4.99.-)